MNKQNSKLKETERENLQSEDAKETQEINQIRGQGDKHSNRDKIIQNVIKEIKETNQNLKSDEKLYRDVKRNKI